MGLGRTVRFASLHISHNDPKHVLLGTFVEPFISILAETIFLGDYVRLTKYERNYFVEEPAKLEM